MLLFWIHDLRYESTYFYGDTYIVMVLYYRWQPERFGASQEPKEAARNAKEKEC